jgi:hypothetical protein
LLGFVLRDSLLLISGSLVRAQQAEPNNQAVSQGCEPESTLLYIDPVGTAVGTRRISVVIDSQKYIDHADGDVHLALSFSIAKNAGYHWQIQVLKDEIRRLGGDPEKVLDENPMGA